MVNEELSMKYISVDGLMYVSQADEFGELYYLVYNIGSGGNVACRGIVEFCTPDALMLVIKNDFSRCS